MFVRALLSKHLKKQDARRRELSEMTNQQPYVSLKLNKLSGKYGFEGEWATAQDAFEPLTSEQAKQLRLSFLKQGSVISPWRIIAWQLAAGLLMAVMTWLIYGKAVLALSVAYGALAVVIPAALFARGLMSRFSSMNAMTAGIGFFVWEALKIVVSIVLIALAPKVVAGLDWLAMLIGLIVTMKVVWVVLWLSSKNKIAA